MNDPAPAHSACPDCGQPMRASMCQLPMWLGAEMNMIEDVPVHVCDACSSQVFDPEVEAAIRALVATGFPDRLATRQMVVPVFQLDGFLVAAYRKVAAE